MKILRILAPLLVLTSSALANRDELVRQGDVYDAKFQPEEALKFYLQAEKLQPASGALLVKIARQYAFRMDDLKSEDAQIESGRTSVKYAEQAVKVAPNDSDSHLALAICLGRLAPYLGNKEGIESSRQIQQASKTALKLNPRNDYAWHILGRWHYSLAGIGGVKRAIATLVYGSIPEASYEEAAKCFEKALALRPDRLVHHIELGRTYAAMQRTEDAINYLNKGLAMPTIEKDDPETKARGRATLSELKPAPRSTADNP